MKAHLFSSIPFSVVVWIVQMIAYHGIGLWFEWLDRTHRLQAYKTRPADRMSYFEILPRALFNQTFVLLPCMVAVEMLGLAYVGSESISVVMFLVGMATLTIGHDLVQYVSHCWILHRPALMRKLGHSVHHTTTASRAISACYMSVADFFLEIVCPYLIPLIIFGLMPGGGGANRLFHFLTVTAGAFGGLYEHSGYDFSLKLAANTDPDFKGALSRFVAQRISSKAHAEHHGRGNVSFSDGFGSSNICDTVFKTRWDLVAPRERRRQSASNQAE